MDALERRYAVPPLDLGWKLALDGFFLASGSSGDDGTIKVGRSIGAMLAGATAGQPATDRVHRERQS